MSRTKKIKMARRRYWIEVGKRSARLSLLGVLFCAFYVAVCAGGPSPVAVSGVVVYQGQPVPNVNVILIGRGNATATGMTGADGRFANMTTNLLGDGAFPGHYTVGIAPINTGQDPNAPLTYQVPPPPPFPPKFLSADTSGLKVTVQPSGVNNFTLELKD